MANAPTSQPDADHPALKRVRALLALMMHVLGDPTRAAQLERLFALTERLLVRLTFEAAARIAGRTDLLHTHEAYAIHKRGGLQIGVRAKLCALAPLHQVILKRHRAAALNRYQRAIARRPGFSRKLSRLHFNNQRRRQNVVATRRSASCASPCHTPARINAPP